MAHTLAPLPCGTQLPGRRCKQPTTPGGVASTAPALPPPLHPPKRIPPVFLSAPLPVVVCQVDFALSSAASRAQLPALPAELQPPRVPRRVTCEAGSILGELDFFLQRPRRWGRVCRVLMRSSAAGLGLPFQF